MENSSEILFGNSVEFVRLAILGRSDPERTDYWEGNWVFVKVELAIGGFRADIDASLRTEELAAFRQQIKQMYQANEGEAVLNTLEDWIELHLRAGGRDHVECKGFVRDEPGIGNELTFSLALDQSVMPAIIASLDTIVFQYPVIGSP